MADKTVKAAVLADCGFGKAGDVIEIDEATAKSSADLDPAPSAVKYREDENAKREAQRKAAEAEGAGALVKKELAPNK